MTNEELRNILKSTIFHGIMDQRDPNMIGLITGSVIRFLAKLIDVKRKTGVSILERIRKLDTVFTDEPLVSIEKMLDKLEFSIRDYSKDGLDILIHEIAMLVDYNANATALKVGSVILALAKELGIVTTDNFLFLLRVLTTQRIYLDSSEAYIRNTIYRLSIGDPGSMEEWISDPQWYESSNS